MRNPRLTKGIPYPNTQALWGQGEQGRDLWSEISLPSLWNVLSNARRPRGRRQWVGKIPSPLLKTKPLALQPWGQPRPGGEASALHLRPLGSLHFHLPGFLGGSYPASELAVYGCARDRRAHVPQARELRPLDPGFCATRRRSRTKGKPQSASLVSVFRSASRTFCF